MNIRSSLSALGLAVITLAPTLVFAQVPIPVRGNAITLADVVYLVQRIMNIGIVLATLAIVAMIIYAGFKMATSAGDDTGYKKAKSILYQAIWGGLVVFGVGLIVNTIANVAFDPTRALY